MLKKKIVHLAKWYPNKIKPLLGIFIQKHIKSLDDTFYNLVISIYPNESIKSSIERVSKKENNFEEIIYFHKKGIINKLNAIFLVYKEVKNFQPDLIHSHVMGWTSTLAYLISTINQIPYCISEHWSGYRNNYYLKLLIVSKFLRKKCAKNAKFISIVSNTLKQDMLKYGINGNYCTIENVVDGKVCNQQKYKPFTFVFAGDLIQEIKNVKGILIAFSEFLKKNDHIKLEIIGEGKDLEDYKKLTHKLNIDHKVYFHGPQSNEYVLKVMSQSHVLVLNSYYETFSIVCSEALLCGIPVISTKCGGPESYLNDKTGILIPVDDQEQLIQAMGKILQTYNSFNPLELQKVILPFKKKTIGKKFKEMYLNSL